MPFTPIPHGTLTWDVPLNAALQDLWNQLGSVGYQYLVAASNAPDSVKAVAQYVCDGTADQVEVQAAIDAAKTAGGGIVQLSGGAFAFASQVSITGTTDENDARTIILRGAGQQATEITVASGQTGIEITDWAQCHICDLALHISGPTGIGVHSTGVTSGDTLSFWQSSFKNLRINGGFTGTDTTWGMWLEMPWRSVFENIEIEGCRNGIRLVNDSAVQNAGDSIFSRFFVELAGTGGYALYVDSIDGNMNQNTWIDFEAGAGSTGCTGIYLGGTAGTASQRFIGNLNLEQFQTLINVANGNSNVFDCNYITCDTGGASNKGFVTGSNSYNNTFRAAFFNIATSDTVQVIEDGNTTSNAPNIFERIRIENNTSATVTYTASSSTVLRDITTFNTGNTMPAGLLQYPLSVVNNPTFTPNDHGLITWTQDPATLRSGGDSVTAGVVYLSKVKIVDRSTVVSNIKVGLVNTPTLLTAGQNFVGLYDSSGTLLVSSADQAAAWATAGEKTAAITPQTLAVGTYYVAILANFTGTAPQFATGAGHGQSAVTNSGLSTGTSRFLTSGAAQTALPASITLGSATPNSGSRWAALT